MTISECINWLVEYGITCGLTEEEDRIYKTNSLMEALKLNEIEEGKGDIPVSRDQLDRVLEEVLDYAVSTGIIEEGITSRDLFDTKIMGILTPLPGTVIRRFNLLKEKDTKAATDYFYKLSGDCNYIRTNRVKKDMKWKIESDYGQIDITINLSKPEKDPRAIAAAKLMKKSGYPACQLCVENEGYAGRKDHPARQNLRIIPLVMNNEDWGFQYSPYVYYNEHCIILNRKHVPMKIDRATFVKLLDFVEQFPHYILGSNADLPIVGGSILTHDHFQGGNYEFAMARAGIEKKIVIKDFEDVDADIVKWPMSVIRLTAAHKDRLISLADKILITWRGYTDEKTFIFAETNGEKHNTITPIARMKNGKYQLDLVLRNNITTEEHPLGVYHPHSELHHIKKENIGLIEVMGCAILPARLKKELEDVKTALINNTDITADPVLVQHAPWVKELRDNYGKFDAGNVDDIIRNEVGKVFVKVLEDAGVYKCTDEGRAAFLRFIDKINE
ncbi:MAG: UDP-glucose--hexose-1-phosphate uridylyltransferase [Lachnospiraceae bacterium]|nr:UDP-glucose--hexose-1-phosphate uridylyltransferase [Lachnospiraceae bacterium]